MNHKQYIDSVTEYRLKSGQTVNYYDGGKQNNPPGSLAKDKMSKLLARGDSKANGARKRKNDLGLINDPQ
ncbi:MAG TPA: hypothetical protein VNU45_18035 [Rummeliibacillus sp.]|nr:hypothetical protein [Rummeliibacillus sp.]